MLLAQCLCVISPSVRSYGVFERLAGFVMAYSFTDEEAGFLGATAMVPFVDLLNHSSCHHVELTFHPKHLRLQAVRHIGKVSGHMRSCDGDVSCVARERR